MEGKRINNIIEHLESTAPSDEIIARINKPFRGKMNQTIGEALGVLSDTRRMIDQARRDIDALNLKEKSERTDAILADIDRKTKIITVELQDTSENLRLTAENLQKLSESLNRNPSDLIFTKPAPPRKPLE